MADPAALRDYCVICDEVANDLCIAKGHTIRRQKRVPAGINQEWRWEDLHETDWLVDIFERNSHLTKFLRDNAPRDDMPEKILNNLKGQTINNIYYAPEAIDKAIAELSTMRNTLALYAEVAEYNDETPFKWWGRGAWNTQQAKAAEELIDALHFLMIAFEDLNLRPVDIYQLYCEKNRRNWSRFEKKLGWKEPQR